jgi:hypothetical protein
MPDDNPRNSQDNKIHMATPEDEPDDSLYRNLDGNPDDYPDNPRHCQTIPSHMGCHLVSLLGLSSALLFLKTLWRKNPDLNQ